MTIKQISVFAENRRGSLAQIASILAKENIDIRALSVADTTNYGILRLIADNPDAAQKALNQAGFAVSQTDVVAACITDQPGGLAAVLDCLDKAGLEVEYVYAFISRDADQAYVILRVEDTAKAASVLEKAGIKVLSGEEVYGL